jgi:UDP-N-acetyl-D-glucosamine dehydrogenase
MTVAPVREAEPPEVESSRCRVGVVGLGYVGLPQAMVFAGGGHPVVGVDVDPAVVRTLRAGRSVVDTVTDKEVHHVQQLLRVTSDATELATCSAIMICVPTPVDGDARPDLTALRAACRAVADQLVAGQLVVVESTVHPGATDTVVKPILETSGLVAGVHFNLAFAPERIDPGNRLFGLANTPKVVGGYTSVCARRATELYRGVVPKVHVAKGLREAEAAKILENTYRQVNLALVHEFADYCEAQGIDVMSVIEAAATKPFGYQPFYPGGRRRALHPGGSAVPGGFRAGAGHTDASGRDGPADQRPPAGADRRAVPPVAGHLRDTGSGRTGARVGRDLQAGCRRRPQYACRGGCPWPARVGR